MFAVKATYKGETRKFSLSTDAFPTFEQLCNHLYRVFPISHNFYICRLLFSPNVTQGGRILVGREVRTQEDYDKSIEPYNERRWPHGLLKFSVYDETSYKPSDITQAFPARTPHFCSYSAGGRSRPASMLSAPCISPPNTTFPKPLIVNMAEPDKGMGSAQKACCSVQSAREDIQRLITDFKHDLDNILATNLTSKQIVSQSPLPPFSPAPSSTGHSSDGTSLQVNLPLCSVCARGKQRSWIVCDYCHVVECVDCSGKAPSFCFGTMATHQWRQSSAASVVTPSFMTQLPGQKSWNLDSSSSVSCAMSTDPQTPRGRTPVAPFIPPPMGLAISGENFRKDTPQPRAVVHHGIMCDGCQSTITGSRHKCLDCPDYDLCDNCVLSGSKARHNSCHEFFEVTEPSRVVVHRMREPPVLRDADRNAHQATAVDLVGIITHHATCDLCDSRIEGDRYKCLDCPDFDTCSACFSITEIQHPGHGFARLRRPEDFIERRRSNSSTHYASCNICARRIHGVRYKCMHHDCPDFDLCDVCEAHPIALHPKSHPLLKMKTPETLVSSIRPQETSFSSNSLKDVQLEDVNHDRHQPIPVPPEPSSPFVWGYMHASTLSKESRPRTPVVQPKLIPRLDEISPSLIRVPLEELSRASLIEDVDHSDTWPVPVPYDTEKVEERRENRTDAKRLSESLKHCRDPGCLGSEATWPAAAAELAHLMPSVEPSLHCDMSIRLQHGHPPSPLTGEEALLSAPGEVALSDMRQKSVPPVTVSRQTLAMLLGEQESLSKFELSSTASLEEAHPMLPSLKVGTSESGTQLRPGSTEADHLQCGEEKDGKRAASILERVEQFAPKKNIQEFKDKVYLSAMFVEDVTVPDGQVFPPGAEFMKCWRVLNDSESDWPETTELVYVAGEMLGTHKDVAVSVGLVKSGSEIELWTGELKAPDVAGRYVSYWRLRDEGVSFGDSIWIDIVVADAHSSDESDTSIASSLVIMPQSVHTDTSGQLDSQGITEIDTRNQVQDRDASTLASGTLTVGTLTLPSSSSGIDSDADSEVSMVSIPSSDGEMWEDVGSQVGDATSGQSQSQAIDYVLLYDDRSSEDE